MTPLSVNKEMLEFQLFGYSSIRELMLHVVFLKSKSVNITALVGGFLLGFAAFLEEYVMADKTSLILITVLFTVDTIMGAWRAVKIGEGFKTAKAFRVIPKILIIMLFLATFKHYAEILLTPLAAGISFLTVGSIAANAASAGILPNEISSKILKYIDSHKDKTHV